MLEQLSSFFDELEKIGGLNERLVEAVIKNIRTNPVKYLAAYSRHEKGKQRYRQTEAALEHPYPAGWVPLGIQPRD